MSGRADTDRGRHDSGRSERSDRTGAFDELAGSYRRFRPGYPDAVLALLRDYVCAGRAAPGGRPWLLLDVGAGTGISTRALVELFGDRHDVVGVEPGRGMRSAADGRVRLVDGRAEALPAGDATATLVLAAQAVQWFDRPAFYAEAVRVTRAGGTVAILQNDRDWARSPLLDAYEELMETCGDDYSRHYRSFDIAAELDGTAGLGEAVDHEHEWVRTIDRDGFLGMAASSTKMHAVVRRLGPDEARARLDKLLDTHCPDTDRVDIPYTTRLFLRRRVPGGPA